jgi:DNA-binding NarL/FixJ family response regulator
MPLPFKVLVVEDYEPFRHFVCSMLKKNGVAEVFEARDGEEGVEAARRCKPELVLLDIGLPKLDGIAVARGIQKLSARSTILFVSQESSPEVIAEAFRVGASGYLAKTDAGRDLVSAIRASMRGEQFVSPRLRFAPV